MGYQTSAWPTPANVLHLASELPEGSIFFCAGLSVFQHPMNTMAVLLGGHVRVGLEDNLYYRRGQKFTGNAEAVTRVTRLIEELQRPVATPAQARTILGVAAEPRQYG
jgi:3-keto-5-aminohexanoate cleavage enzyme